MVEHRYFISFFITSLIYLALAGSYFFFRDTLLIAEQKATDNTICMCLSEFVPEPVVPPAEEPVEEVIEEPVEEVIEEPVKEEEPIVEEKPKEEPVLEKEPIIPVEPPKPKTPPKPKPEKKKEPVKKKPMPPKPAPKKAAAPKGAAAMAAVKQGTAQKDNVARKNAFLAAIRQKINQNKSYPLIAKRRGMQGKVIAQFTILSNGSVADIKLSGSKIFHASARQAIQKAFPVNAAGKPFSFPIVVNLALEYRLTQN
ncbi:MAG: energy transducer TonB [Sulfurovum sp.]|nr:energy transducer TonB [Sulfurovum sp.]MDD3601832.1 energy transducer TonB [Sulfurovum sp.]